MFRVSLLCLAYFSIVMAVDDVTTIPICPNKAANDIYFDLSNMGLDSIRKYFVSGPSVTCVNLAGNHISQLEKGAFDGLPELSYLNFARNPISFEDFMNQSLPSLRTLILDGPFIDENGNNNDNQQHIPSSEYYTDTYYGGVSKNRLFYVHPIFLPNLEKLSLSNYVDRPVSTWLDYFIVPNLTHLYISKNSFTGGNMPKTYTETLTHLNMDDNQVYMFATNFPKLRYLSMDRNRIENVCNQNCYGQFLSLRDIPELEYLSLVGNMITTIETGAFDDSINLRVLNLAANKITYLPRHLFNSMPNLKNVSLAENKLTEIPDLCGLGQLEILNVNKNQISSIDDTSFCNLTQLSYIDISQNGLTNIADGTFEQLCGLTILDLSWNNIAALPVNWIRSGHVLHFLNLDGNKFDDIANMSLGPIEKFDKLSIGKNPLKMATVSSLTSLPPDMKIDISRVCDSELYKP